MKILNFEELLNEALNALNEIPNKKINGSTVFKNTYQLASMISKSLGIGLYKKEVIATYYSVDDVLLARPELTKEQACDVLDRVNLSIHISNLFEVLIIF